MPKLVGTINVQEFFLKQGAAQLQCPLIQAEGTLPAQVLWHNFFKEFRKST